MFFKIPRCYDSHTHFLESGLMDQGLQLSDLKDPRDIKKYPIHKKDFRGDWLVGFGWDQNKWSDKKFPTKEILDEIFPDIPVNLTRADGHASWVNSEALKRVGLYNKSSQEFTDPLGGVIVRDLQDYPTGIVLDAAKYGIVDLKLPPYSLEQKKEALKKAIKLFNSEGFTHVRDMSCDLEQWFLLKELDQQGELTLYLDENFTCEHAHDVERVLRDAQKARENSSPHLRVAGIKFYYDGALGSEGAYLSENYQGKNHRGFTMWNINDLERAIEKAWGQQFPVAIHTIGDQAVHEIAQLIWQMHQQGKKVQVNLEHVQLIRPETLLLLQKIKAHCHLQPCHFLSDRRWLKNKLGPLYKNVFRWRDLQSLGVQVSWGSDSPIEATSLKNNFQALEMSAQEDIPAFVGDVSVPHSHPDKNWGEQCYTVYQEGKVEVYFDGRRL